MIVDDSRFSRARLTNILIKAGHKVVGEAENGRLAVSLYRNSQPDLVIMDITMPEMSGLKATQIIKDEFSDARIVMCSAMGHQRMVVEAIETGAKDFIVKPFDENKVLDTINRVLK